MVRICLKAIVQDSMLIQNVYILVINLGFFQRLDAFRYDASDKFSVFSAFRFRSLSASEDFDTHFPLLLGSGVFFQHNANAIRNHKKLSLNQAITTHFLLLHQQDLVLDQQ